MVAVRGKRTVTSLVAVALVAGPFWAASAGALSETVEPECYSADDGTEAYICELARGCEEDTDADSCSAPSRCEVIDANVVRCEPVEAPSDTNQSSVSVDVSAMIPDSVDAPSGAPTLDDLVMPAESIAHPRDPAVECKLDAANASLVCKPTPECREDIQRPTCKPPSYCDPIGDSFYRCHPPEGRSPDNATDSGASVNVETSRPASAGIDGPDEASAAADVEAAIEENVTAAADAFGTDLSELRAAYDDRMDQLRQEYQDRKQQLRNDYETCRSQVSNDNATGTSELRECLQEARDGLDSLRTEMRQRQQNLTQAFSDRAEEARQQACRQVEDATLTAIGDHVAFNVDVQAVVNDDALDLCPSLADLAGGA